MLALVAMMVATLFAVQQHRNVLHMRMQQIDNEVATATTAVAMDRLENIGAHAFDEVLEDSTQITSANSLTPESEFTTDDPDNDIDDFDQAEKDLMYVIDADTLWFRSYSTVSYASENDPEQEVNTPTKSKKATVRVYCTTVAHSDTVELSRTYSCGSGCTW